LKPPRRGETHFLKPAAPVRLLNKTIGILARFGLVPDYVYVLEVRGRRTGKTYSTPVNLLKIENRQFLVGGRGHSAWSRNAAAAGTVKLIRGKTSREYRAIALSADEKPEILRRYLREYRYTVQRFFTLEATAPTEAFRAIADRHPVFELVAL
jgi:deazaflavin-dependent oxidoreductase (nitroreductase family)